MINKEINKIIASEDEIFELKKEPQTSFFEALLTVGINFFIVFYFSIIIKYNYLIITKKRILF